MSLKIRRGTNAERLTITPAEGELIYTTDTKNLYIGDGSTSGGKFITGLGYTGSAGVVTVSGYTGSAGSGYVGSASTVRGYTGSSSTAAGYAGSAGGGSAVWIGYSGSSDSYFLPRARTTTTGFVLTGNIDGTTSWKQPSTELTITTQTGNEIIVDLIEEKLDWVPNYPLYEGLVHTYEWINKQVNKQ